jgi:type VI secretion system VgrG family protein
MSMTDTTAGSGYTPGIHDIYISFQAGDLDQKTFEVVTLTGREAISEPYELSLDLVSADPDIDAAQVLGKAARIVIDRDDEGQLWNGIVSSFEQGDTGPELTFYRARVVPWIHFLGLVRQTRVFQNLTVPAMIEEVLKSSGFATSDHYEIRTGRTYPEREYVVQYQETDLDFIRRLMEHEGISFFFKQGDEREKLFITDLMESHEAVPGDSIIPFRDARAVNPGGEAVSALTSRTEIVPDEVHLLDYNYRKPELLLRSLRQESDSTGKRLTDYGDHFKVPAEGDQLAAIRSEEMQARRTVFQGDSACFNLRSGFWFDLIDHARESYNTRYLVTEIIHEGRQMAVLGTAYGGAADRPSYNNRFTAIPATVRFRPSRTTPKPRVHGILNAVVDASVNGKYAEIDEMGRYRITMFHDLSGNKDAKASRAIRMAQPYSGPEYGFHFPLHKGTEVLLTHVDGDPDRPIIAASVPNPATASPVTNPNQTQSVIRTAALNEILIEDLEGSERIHIHTPHSKSAVDLGARHKEPAVCPNGITLATEQLVSANAGAGVHVAAGAADHIKGVKSGRQVTQDVKKVHEEQAAILDPAGAVAKDANKAGTDGLETARKDLEIFDGSPADTEALLAKKIVHVSAPDEISIVSKKAATVGSEESVTVTSGKFSSLASNGKTFVGGVEGVSAVSRDDVEVISLEKDVILRTVRKNVRIEAETDIAVTATRGNIDVKGPEKYTLKAKTVEETAETAMTLKMETLVIEASKSIEIKCGSASIKLESNGNVTVKGATLELKGNQEFKMEAPLGTVKASGKLEVSSAGLAEIKGALVKIN